jgi:hypothetical protein
VGVPVPLGVSPITAPKRRKKEEFNPFAKDASQQHRRRRDERERQTPRRPTPVQDTPAAQPKPNIEADFQRKQRDAMKKLKQKGDVAARPVAPAPVPTHRTSRNVDEKPTSLSREARLAELRRKSEELKKSAPSNKLETPVPPTEPVVADVASPVIDTLEPSMEAVDALKFPAAKKVKNVFQTIETNIAPKKDRRRGRRRMDKKGGGRQKQQKKLNRQKYLEYKYAAKDILEDPNVPEEHRSNVLGQVWAKGERLGIDDCLEFIEQKEEELILPSEIADKLRKLVSTMITRR